MDTKVIKIDSADSAISAAGDAAKVLREGGIVGFPTETVYGLAAAYGTSGYKRLRELKARPDRPFTVHIGKAEQAQPLIGNDIWQARCLMRKAWPGPLTLVLPAADSVSQDLCMEGFIGLRLPDNTPARLMLAAAGGIVLAPSANLAGEKPSTSAQEVLDCLGGRIELVIDDGPTRQGKASTIVRFNEKGDYKILRQGAIEKDHIQQLCVRRICFVCTGNTCRSPMAEGLMRKAVSEHIGCEPHELRKHGWDIISASMAGMSNCPATDPAITAADKMGADIAGHLSRSADQELINSADLIFCMTEGHLMAARSIAPAAAERIMLLDERSDVPDPIGGPQSLYDRTAKRIAQAIDTRMELALSL